ncbi:MAG: matrixin family metalloprotease [Bacillota bacterium]|nr:matrixin family metalloprotease [Bacillota bacterium]
MKKRKLGSFLLIVVILTLVLFSFSVNAQYGDYIVGHKLSSGVSNVHYYLDPSMSSTYQNAITSAMNSWCISGCDVIKVTQVTDLNSAEIKFSNKNYVNNSATQTARGYTLYYINGSGYTAPGAASFPTTDWLRCSVVLKDNLSFAEIVSTACHEIGHCLGLVHPSESVIPSSVMFTYDSTKRTNAPTIYDVTQINKIY